MLNACGVTVTTPDYFLITSCPGVFYFPYATAIFQRYKIADTRDSFHKSSFYKSISSFRKFSLQKASPFPKKKKPAHF